MAAETLDHFQTNNGEPLDLGMFVCVLPGDPNVIGSIDNMYRNEGKAFVQIRRYYRPKELQHEPPSKALNNEVYQTNHFDCHLVESIENICKVFIKSEYLNEARSVCEEDIFFFEYNYSDNGSFTKISASGNAHLSNSSNRTMEAPLKVLINALIDLEETLSKDTLPATWASKRSTWIANLKHCDTVHSITQELLHFVESLQLTRENTFVEDKRQRWSAKRYRVSQEKIMAIMHDKEGVPGKPISRSELITEAQKFIRDSGLLANLLKEMADTVITNGKRFRRRHNSQGVIEFWLEDANLMDIRKQADIQDPCPGYGKGMTTFEAEEMRTIKEELIMLKSELFSVKNMNIIEKKKMLPQEMDGGILKEILKYLEVKVKFLRQDVRELQIKSLGKAKVETSQTECPVEQTNLSEIKMSACNIVDQVEKLETLEHTLLQEIESNHRAENKQLEDQNTKVTEALERMKEEMKSVEIHERSSC